MHPHREAALAWAGHINRRRGTRRSAVGRLRRERRDSQFKGAFEERYTLQQQSATIRAPVGEARCSRKTQVVTHGEPSLDVVMEARALCKDPVSVSSTYKPRTPKRAQREPTRDVAVGRAMSRWVAHDALRPPLPALRRAAHTLQSLCVAGEGVVNAFESHDCWTSMASGCGQTG